LVEPFDHRHHGTTQGLHDCETLPAFDRLTVEARQAIEQLSRGRRRIGHGQRIDPRTDSSRIHRQHGITSHFRTRQSRQEFGESLTHVR